MKQNKETTLSSALQRAGFNVAESRLRQSLIDVLTKCHRNEQRAITLFMKENGDDLELFEQAALQAMRILNKEMLGAGQGTDDVGTADVHKLNAGTGQPDRGGEGKERPSAKPIRFKKPGHSTRGLSSISAIKGTFKEGLMFIKKTYDNRAWGDVGWHELDGLDRDGAIARIIKRKFPAPANRFAKLSEILTEKEFQQVIDEAKKQNDAA